MAEELSVEGSGETVGEAKWAALRELDRLRPGIDKAAVQFEVLTEGKRGLLGVGYAPALVVARLADLPEPEPAAAPPDEPESDLLADVRQIVERIADSLGATCRVEARQKPDHIDVQCSGGDLGVLIGRHGQTIDAIQYLVNAIASRREGERVEVVVDAAGYRSRRRSTLETIAVRAARRALDDGEPVELEPMTAIERKLVHTRLEEFRGVETSSEGTEPNRFVVISPVD
jgi:spoIIIJ-associated protein